MIMADIFLWTFVILGTYAVINAYWLVSAGLFPAMVERCERRYSERPVVTTLVGVAATAPLVVLAVLAGKSGHGVVKLAGLILALTPVLLGLLGSAGLARRVGSGLASAIDQRQPWRRVLRGGLALGLTFVLPVIGWFFVLPWTLVSGFGALVMSLPRKRKAPVAMFVPAPPPVPPANVGAASTTPEPAVVS